MSDERLFDLDTVPEVPLLRALRARKGAAKGVWSDARFLNDYPPEWHRCTTCRGTGKVLIQVERESVGYESPCRDCLGMGSVKAMVRRLAGHRCERCLHPYMPKGDALMLGVEPSWREGGWSACDEKCDHAGPLRIVDGEVVWEGDASARELLPARGQGVVLEAAWRVLTVHHLDGDKANLAWWNLCALDQRCHLEVQAKVVMERVYPHEHSTWFRPHAAGYYAKVYLGLDLSREETMERLDELLALELAPA